jgi:hypothetical protein
MTRTPPKVENAPGLIWRTSSKGWEARWQCRTDMINAGFMPKSQRMWEGVEPTAAEAAAIADGCTRLQDEMKIFGRGGLPKPLSVLEGTLRSLINCYQTDTDSSYHKKRYAVRKNHDFLLRRIAERQGSEELRDIKARVLLAWHKDWSNDGQKLAMAHAVIGQYRVLFGFGATILEDPDCERLCGVMGKMRFPMAKPRIEHMTADHAIALRVQAHRRGWESIALAQAIQFEGTLRQKDVIGEWIPVSEPGISDVISPKGKWLMGVRWEEIDENLILRHNTSKRGKDIEIDLRLAPMVLEELALYSKTPVAELTRAVLPPSGPVIICEVTGWPYSTAEFRRKWRVLANMAGIPKAVRNMDSRAGAISEAVTAGAPLTLVRHAATHSDIGMTQKYDRQAAQATATVMKMRVVDRNKPKTD